MDELDGAPSSLMQLEVASAVESRSLLLWSRSRFCCGVEVAGVLSEVSHRAFTRLGRVGFDREASWWKSWQTAGMRWLGWLLVGLVSCSTEEGARDSDSEPRDVGFLDGGHDSSDTGSAGDDGDADDTAEGDDVSGDDTADADDTEEAPDDTAGDDTAEDDDDTGPPSDDTAGDDTAEDDDDTGPPSDDTAGDDTAEDDDTGQPPNDGEDDDSIPDDDASDDDVTDGGIESPADDDTAEEPEPSDLSHLNDEFDDPATRSDWQRVNDVEQWNADQLETFDIDTSRPGSAFLRPYTSGWYGDRRGALAFKLISGDFVVTSHVIATERDGSGPPASEYSLGGLLIRAPRDITPDTWTPGQENYVFLSLGSGFGGQFETEVKRTYAGSSVPEVDPGRGPEATIRIARIGHVVVCLLRWPDDEWVIHRRFFHDLLPETLQVGMTAYTDWQGVSTLDPPEYNRIVIEGANPDLDAEYEYVHFARPEIPAEFAGADLMTLLDAELLGFLGD